MKGVCAVPPYIYKGINFKNQPYEAWKELGGEVAPSHYPPRWLHGLAFRYELPRIFNSKQEARLRFVQPVSISFDTFPDYAIYEIIPFIWDCWPDSFEKTACWLKKHNVKTAMFTSSQTAEKMKNRFPYMNIHYVPEGIDCKEYGPGLKLKQRKNPLYEIGNGRRCFLKTQFPEEYERLSKLPVKGLLPDRKSFIEALCDAQVTVTFPRCDMMPDETGGIETLTQRYWEAMLTRSIIVGRAPEELIDLIGYNPVIDLDRQNPIEQIENILLHIEDFQPLVDKNRETALQMGDWKKRMREVAEWLTSCGYNCNIR